MPHLTPINPITFTGTCSPRVYYGLQEGEKRYRITYKKGLWYVCILFKGRYQHVSSAKELEHAMTLCRIKG